MNRKTNEGKKMGNRSDNDGIQWFHFFFSFVPIDQSFV